MDYLAGNVQLVIAIFVFNIFVYFYAKLNVANRSLIDIPL